MFVFFCHAMQTYVFMVLIEGKRLNNVIRKTVYNKDYFCCDYYEKIGTACVECDIGYTSSKGEPCEPCSGNRYGYRCADKCLLCTANQRCDHIHGCMNISTTDSTQLPEYNTTAVVEFYTNTSIIVNKYDIFVNNAVYIMCLGCACIFGIVLAGIILYKRHKKRTTILNRHAHNETIQHPTENRIESIYEEIDDIILPDPDSNINVELSSNDSTSSDKNSISNSEDQYLNPYQIIVQNIEDRPYSFIGRSETEITNNSDTIARLERYNKESDERKKKNLRKVPLENKFHSLNYPEILFIKRTDTGNIDKYKNTRTFSKQSKSNPCSQDNTEYVEIVHIV